MIGLTTAATAAFTSDLPPPSLKDLSAEITIPVFFIHSTPGQGGENLTPTYYEAASEPKELWAAKGGHIGAIDAEPQEYERRVVAFFDDALLVADDPDESRHAWDTRSGAGCRGTRSRSPLPATTSGRSARRSTSGRAGILRSGPRRSR